MLATLRMTDPLVINGHSLYETQDELENLEEEDTTLYYFGGLFRRDEAERALFLDNFKKSVFQWTSKPNDPYALSLLQAHLPTVLRLSINAPFRDIREKSTKILEELKVSYMASCKFTFNIPNNIS